MLQPPSDTISVDKNVRTVHRNIEKIHPDFKKYSTDNSTIDENMRSVHSWDNYSRSELMLCQKCSKRTAKITFWKVVLVQETLFADKFFLTVILPLKLNIPKTEPMSFKELLSLKPLTLLLTFFVIPRREV